MFKKAFAFAAIVACLAVPAEAKHLKTSVGWVAADGTIRVGTGFSVTHAGTGQYTVSYPAGSFAGTPILACTPAGITSLLPICDIWSYNGTNGALTVQFRLYTRKDGDGVDNEFQFMEITAK